MAMPCFRSFITACLLASGNALLENTASQIQIPKSCFNSQTEFSKYFNYQYPWGPDHNGAARMDKNHVAISSNILTITAQPVSGQKPGSHGGKQIPIKYLSGAVHAKNQITVGAGGGYDFSAQFRAPVGRGIWPAFWLTAVKGWPPEIDMAEWKGSGKISFNTFNTSKEVQARDVAYPNPGAWHSVKAELHDKNGKDVEIKFIMDGKHVVTQVGRGYTGAAFWLIINLQMEGSSGAPGPNQNTSYAIRDLEVVSHRR